MNLEDVKLSDVDKMSDSEIMVWFSEMQRREQIKQMKQQLKNYVDVQDSQTIKLRG